MNAALKYGAVTGLFLAAACGVGALGFSLATDTFTPFAASSERSVETRTVAVSDAELGGKPASSLLGARKAHVEKSRANEDAAWVKVTDAVNMRRGPSSENRVIKVQLKGARLRVAARDRGWVEVVEPETGVHGWVYGKYVERLKPVSHRAGLADTNIE